MKEWLLVYKDNETDEIGNITYKNKSKSEAINEFTSTHKITDKIINIIEI